MDITVNISTLKRLRLAHGLSQADAAKKCGISEVYWNEIETGKRLSSPKKTQQIADAFGLHYYDVVAIILRTHEVVHGDGGSSNDE